MLAVSSDCDPAIFQYLTLRDLLAARNCSRAARQRTALPRAKRTWAAVRPSSVAMLDYIKHSTFEQIQHFHAAYEFTSANARDWGLLACACASMELPVVQWVAATFSYTVHDVYTVEAHEFVAACARGRLSVVQWLTDHYAFSGAVVRAYHCHAFRAACVGGHVATAEWLDTRFKLTVDASALGTNNYTLNEVCANGHLEMVKWLVIRFNLTVTQTNAQVYWAFHRACSGGHLAVAQWLMAQFRFTARHVCDDGGNHTLCDACANGRLAVVAWLVTHFDIQRVTKPHDIRRALLEGCKHGHLEVVQYLVRQFGYDPIDIDVAPFLDVACEGGHLAVAQFLDQYFTRRRYIRTPWAAGRLEHVLRTTSQNGNLAFVQWFVSRFDVGAPCATRARRTIRTRPSPPLAMAVAQWLTEYYRLPN
jgi:hypothetical protein